MTSRVIRLRAEDLTTFVNTASRCSFDINIAPKSYEHDYVDAKSLVGVMSLNLRLPLVVTYEGSDPAFENYLAAHAVPEAS